MNIRQKSRLQFLLYLSLSTIYCSSIGSGQGGRATHGKGFVTIPKHNETEFALEQRKDGTRIGESSQMESSITHAMTMIGGRMFSKQFLDIALSGVQFGLCFYVAKAIWKVIAELVEEFDTDHQSAATDDHDMPLFSEEKCNTAAESLASHQERANGAKVLMMLMMLKEITIKALVIHWVKGMSRHRCHRSLAASRYLLLAWQCACISRDFLLYLLRRQRGRLL